MAFVVTDKCINCKFTDCVEVCPVDCFHEGPNFLVINPDECIDCALCEPQCPVQAIVSEDELEGDAVVFKDINARLSQKWPSITQSKPSEFETDYWKNIPNKIKLLREN